MTHEILTIALGQCGNQIISDYWTKYLAFLKLNPDGTLNIENNKEDYKSCRYEVGLMEVGENRFRPRSLMFDLESRVITSILNGSNAEFYDPKSIWMGTEGAGAGNNWAVGYEQGQKNLETLANMIDTELEMCNSAQAITICHSISGGTGSGMGSVLLELLRMKYPKLLLQTYSVAPNTESGTSDVVVQPYNTVLTLDRLVHCADAVHLIQNECLDNISYNSKAKKIKPVNAQNEIIVNSMIGLLNSVLFPSYMDFSLVEILSPLIPIQKAHFLLDSYTSMDPFNLKSSKSENSLANSSKLELITRSFFSNNYISCLNKSEGLYIALNMIYHGALHPSIIIECLENIKERQQLLFTDWTVKDIEYVIASKTPTMFSDRSCLSIANHTSIKSTFTKYHKDFTQMISRRAFIDSFYRSKLFDNLNEFERVEDTLLKLIKEYSICDEMNYNNV